MRGLPPPKTGSLGVIYGAPGTGKTSLLRVVFGGGGGSGSGGGGSWNANKAVVSQVGEHTSPDENMAALQSCGLASVPALLRPFQTLSGGERMKAELARAIHSSATTFDDFGAAVSTHAARQGGGLTLVAFFQLNFEPFVPEPTNVCLQTPGAELKRGNWCEALQRGLPRRG